MKLLEDILRVLNVTGREAERVLRDIHELAESRGARRLFQQLSAKVREKLKERMKQVAADKWPDVIRNAIQEEFNFQQRQEAYGQALGEILEKEFLPTVLQEATEAQRRDIQKIVVGE